MTDTMGSACNFQLVVIQRYVGFLKAYLLNHSEKRCPNERSRNSNELIFLLMKWGAQKIWLGCWRALDRRLFGIPKIGKILNDHTIGMFWRGIVFSGNFCPWKKKSASPRWSSLSYRNSVLNSAITWGKFPTNSEPTNQPTIPPSMVHLSVLVVRIQGFSPPPSCRHETASGSSFLSLEGELKVAQCWCTLW